MEITLLPMAPLLLSSYALVPTPAYAPIPLAEDHQVDHIKVGDIDISSILCSDHQLNLESGYEHCEGAKTAIHNQVFKALRVVDQ